MTEAEWLTCAAPKRMLQSLKVLTEKGPKAGSGDRKLRLFAAACCRSALELVNPPASGSPQSGPWQDVRTAERIADGLVPPPADDQEHQFGSYTLSHGSRSRAEWACRAGLSTPAWDAAAGVIDALDGAIWDDGATNRGAAYLREIFGNPFRPVAFDPAWRTIAAVAIANHVYESRDFSAVPILADALQEAGCDRDDVLTHCRDEKAAHVRGCWVIDLILEKG